MRSSHLLLALALVTAVPSCSCTGYMIQLRDGREIVAASQPEFQPKTGYYRYRTSQGKDALVLREEVIMIEEM